MQPENRTAEQPKSELFLTAIEAYYKDAQPGSARFMALSDFALQMESRFSVLEAKGEAEKIGAVAFRASLEAITRTRESAVLHYMTEGNIVEEAFFHLARLIDQEDPNLPYGAQIPPEALKDSAKRLALKSLDDIVNDIHVKHGSSDDNQLMNALNKILAQ